MKLINRRESQRYPGLFVKKFTKKVFWDNLWHEDSGLLESRGHVELADGTIVIRPFTKIFNYQENGTTIDPEETCVLVRKINGFMACATYIPQIKEVVISTTGSLDSGFVSIAETHLQSAKNWIKWIYDVEGVSKTFMFEICDYTDVHIIPEDFGAYLIGMREVDNDSPYFSNWDLELALDAAALNMDVKRPNWYCDEFKNVLSDVNVCQHEGYVVYGQASKTALKIKSPYYLALKAMARKKDIMTLDKKRVDEEYYGLIDHLTAYDVADMFNALSEQDRLTYIRDYFQNNR